MKRVLSLTLVAALLLAGCSTGKKDELPKLPTQTAAVNVQLGGEPDTLDPAFAVTPGEQSYIMHLLEGLTVLDSNMNAAPGAAASWERTVSDTGLVTYTFTLDENAKWSDGEPVKAEDFIYAWKRVLDPDTKSPVAYRLYPIRGARAVCEDGADAEETLGVTVTEEGALVLELEGDCPDLLERLALTPWMPLRESMVKANKTSWYYDEENYITNGAYKLAEWSRDSHITMEKSGSYRDMGNVTANRLNFILNQNENSLLASLREGTVQLAYDIPQLELEAVENGYPTVLGGYSLVYNTASQVTGDAGVRQALSLALDKSKIAEAMRNGSSPATGLVPPGAMVEGTEFRSKAGDITTAGGNLEAAKSLLSEAGYGEGKKALSIKYLINDEAAHRRVAEAVIEQWSQLGVTVELEAVPWEEYLVLREDGRFDVTRLTVFSDELYPSVFFDSWLSDSAVNFAGYNSNAYDGLIDQSYGREPRESPEPVSEGEAGEPEEKEKTADTAAADKQESTQDVAEGEDEAQQEPAKEVWEFLAEAEKLLMVEDSVVAPLTWHANVFLTAKGFTGVKIYPNGCIYLGQAHIV